MSLQEKNVFLMRKNFTNFINRFNDREQQTKRDTKMSWESIYSATKQTAGGSTDKLVLLMLANLADENGFCFPSHSYLARVTEMSERSVQRSIERLVSRGLLIKESRYKERGQTSNGYTVVMRGDNLTTPPRQNDTHPHDNMTPYTDNNNLKPKQTRKRGNYSAAFNDFWEAYPKRPNDNKWNAFLKWQSATNGLISADDLNRAAQKFNRANANTDPRYIPMCATWLNQRRYEDVLEEPERPTTNRNTLAG